MLEGLMQRTPLMIADLLRHAIVAHGDRDIVSRLVDEPIWRYNYAGLNVRASQAARVLARLGVTAGDRVSSLAWNTHRHLELFYAVPGTAAILHTVNPRFSDDQIIYTVNHAGSRILFFDRSFLSLVERLRPRLKAVEHFVLLAREPVDGVECYEDLIGVEEPTFNWPVFDENAAAMLCYTSGTTGDPKGVLYSHRSTVLHALILSLAGSLNVSVFDVVMPCVPMYHAAAWGLPFIAAINGCKLVLPCERMDGASLQELIQDEGVTFSGGVPTVWGMYLDHLERTGQGCGALRRVMIGGSAVPGGMDETFKSRYGVEVRQVWGMTEMNPLGVVSTPTPKISAAGEDAMREFLRTRQGRMLFGVQLRIVGDDGAELPRDGVAAGALQARGPWTIRRYYRGDRDVVDKESWFDTGDIATLDEAGFMRITDRAKDVIKSGGEWISSIDLENIAAAYPGVKVAAAVGVHHPHWQERPILVVEAHDGAEITEDGVLGHLRTRITRWWMPDKIIFARVPLTATGKIDKKVLRARYAKVLADLADHEHAQPPA